MNNEHSFDWAENVSFAVTVCDDKANIMYMNKKSQSTFASHGNMLGKNLKDCHPPKAWEKILYLLSTGESNSYTIFKNRVKKIIHQTPWYKNAGEKPAGLVEISIVIPEEMPHYVRNPENK